MAEPSGKKGMARGRVALVAASFALAVFSTAGFAFAAAPMLDARSEFPGALADAAAMPEQVDGAGTAAAEGETGAGDAAERAADGSQASDVGDAALDGKSGAKGDAKATADEDAEADADADAEAEDSETGGTNAAGSSRPAAGGSSAGVRPSAGVSAASASAAASNSASSTSEPANSEPTAEELAAAEEAARQERYQAAAHEFEQTCLTTRDIDNMLSICVQSLPVTGYEGGGTLHHYLWNSGEAASVSQILNDVIAECDRHQGMSFYSEEFPELNGYAAQMQTYWQDVMEAAYLLQAFMNNYNNCPGETSDGENYACCVGPLQGHLMVGPYGGATLEYIENAQAIWHQVTDTWVWGY